MEFKYRRILNDAQEILHPPPPPSPPHLSATPANITTNTSGAIAAPAQLNPSSMAVMVLVLAFALFFIGLFFIYARKFLSVSADNSGGGGMDQYVRTYDYDDMLRYNHRRLFHSSSSIPPLGLDAATVRALPLVEYAKDSSGEEENLLCVVCLSEFEDKEKVKLIPSCGHVFHPNCLDAWLISRGCCPLCRCSDIKKSVRPVSLPAATSIRRSSSSTDAAAEEEEDDVHHQVSREDNNEYGGGDRKGMAAMPVAEAVARIDRSSSWSWRVSEEREDNTNVFLRRTWSV